MKLMLHSINRHRGMFLTAVAFLTVETFADLLQPASIITRITNDVTQMQNFINGIMRIMLKAPVTCIGAVVLIIFQMPALLPLMLMILVCAGLLIYGNMKLGYPRFDRMQKKLDGLNRVSREFLSAIRAGAVGRDRTADGLCQLYDPGAVCSGYGVQYSEFRSSCHSLLRQSAGNPG